MYAGSGGGIFGNGLASTKKTLQSTNSTSNLDTYNSGAGMLGKGAYFPTLRQKQNGRENGSLVGSTAQNN